MCSYQSLLHLHNGIHDRFTIFLGFTVFRIPQHPHRPYWRFATGRTIPFYKRPKNSGKKIQKAYATHTRDKVGILFQGNT
jgi:hypothetical protein